MTSTIRPARLALCTIFLTTLMALIGVPAASASSPAPMPTPWSSSGVATNTVTSDGTTGADPSFNYDASISSCGYCDRSWSFSTTSSAATTVPLHWHYAGLHSWYNTSAHIQAFVDHDGTRTAVTLQSGSVYGGFDWSGSVTLTVASGDTYGFIVGGSHYDYSDILRGTLTVHLLAPPTVTIGNVTPTITDATVEANQPGGASVTYTSSATDTAGAALPSSCTDERGSVISSPATFALGGPHSIVCSATDSYGITGQARVDFRVVDTTAPVVTVPADLTVAATSASGASVTLPAATATDIVDGPVTPSCSVPAGTPTNFGLGTTVVTCSATDAAGNTSAPQSYDVTVTYPWTGFLPPVSNDGTSAFKAGSTVPVKFALSGSSGPITDAKAALSFAKLTSTSADGTYLGATSTSAATTGSLFRYDGSQYIFNWSTKGLSPGTYRLKADLGDGAVHTVQIALK